MTKQSQNNFDSDIQESIKRKNDSKLAEVVPEIKSKERSNDLLNCQSEE
jgi:hypothetical protein